MQSVSCATSIDLLGTSTCLAYAENRQAMVTLLESFIQGRLKQGLGEMYDNYKEEIKRKFGDYVYQHS